MECSIPPGMLSQFTTGSVLKVIGTNGGPSPEEGDDVVGLPVGTSIKEVNIMKELICGPCPLQSACQQLVVNALVEHRGFSFKTYMFVPTPEYLPSEVVIPKP
jgi:hypothetical protein